MTNSGIGEPIPIKRTRKEKIIDFMNSKWGHIPPYFVIAILLLPYLGIQPVNENLNLEEDLSPQFFIDFRNDRGTYSTKIINLNSPSFGDTNTIKIEGFVPNPGRVTVTIENYTIVAPSAPKYFEITKHQTSYKDWFNVNSGAFSEEVTISLSPRIRTIDMDYFSSLENYGTCMIGGMINVYYKIEYYDAVKEENIIRFLNEPFGGEWEMRKKDTLCSYS